MRILKGIGVLFIDVIALTAIDPDCNGATAATVSWTDLGETYQLERSTDAVTWSIIYTGISTTKLETLSNVDQVYYYRVKVVGGEVYSNVGAFQIYEQNKQLNPGECDNYNVAPYYWRTPRRLNCGVTYTYVVDEARCKSKEISCGGTSPYKYYNLTGFPGTVTWSTTFSFTCPEAVGKSGACNGASPASWVATDFWEPGTPVTVTLVSATFSGQSATFTYSATGAGTRGRSNWLYFSFTSLTAS